jgi:ABC-type sugar transport system ATPase subunit
MDRQTIYTRVRRGSKTLEIEKLVDRLPEQLSGGEQQRVAVPGHRAGSWRRQRG